MSYVWMALAGLVIGALAKWIMPGKDPGGFFVTMLIGIVGALLGNWIGDMIYPTDQYSLWWWVYAILGALLVLYIWKKVLAPMIEKAKS